MSVFDHDVRVLVCPSCAAPYKVPPAGGSVKCTFCGAMATVQARRANLQSTSGLSESQRFEKLRAQDGKPLMPPKALAHYFFGGGLDPRRADKAMQDWQSHREQVANGAPFPVAEGLYFLTLLLVSFHADEPERARGLLETALDTLEDRRHRQVLSAMLCRQAARLGELEDAEQWLAVCDPKPDDLHMDTAWRHARAYLDTVAGDYDKVLATLGADLTMLPIADAEEEAIGVLRANAHECRGDLATATEQLATLARRSAQGSGTIAKVLEINADLDLCPESGPAALELVPIKQPQGLQKPGCGSLALMMIFPASFGGGALMFFGVGGSALVYAIGSTFFHWRNAGGADWSLAIVFPMVGSLFALISLVSAWFAVSSWRFRRAAELTQGEILSVETTRVRVNDRPLLALQVRVVPPEGAPFTVDVRTTVPEMVLGRVVPGLPVNVAYVPGRTDHVDIVWG